MSVDIFSDGDLKAKENLKNRHRLGKIWHVIFFSSTAIGVIALTILLLSIINQSFGYVIWTYKVNPSTLSNLPLEEMDSEKLIATLRKNIKPLRLRTIEKEKPLEERNQDELLALLMEKVVEPKVEKTYPLYDSLFNKAFIEQELKEKYPQSVMTMHSWINLKFLERSMSSQAQLAGVRSALKGSLLIILITILFAFPIGVGAAIYLEEYADPANRINRIIQTNIDNLSGVPSIVYGILGLAIFVRAMSVITSGELFGVSGGNGRTILSAGLTLALLILPLLIINGQEAIRAVPNSLRQASYGIGATKWQTIWFHVLPYALPGILTGTILAISRAIGETAPLILVGASTFITNDPNSIFSRFTALPIQIYGWTVRPQPEFRNIAAAAIIVLLTALLSLNAAAILLRNRFMSKRT